MNHVKTYEGLFSGWGKKKSESISIKLSKTFKDGKVVLCVMTPIQQ